jgi:hypothetical protein
MTKRKIGQKRFSHPRFGIITLERWWINGEESFCLVDECGEVFSDPEPYSYAHRACARLWNGEPARDLIPL